MKAPTPHGKALRIVMPVLNEGGTLVARLQALAPLRARGVELVVVDGGSTDDTWAIASALADQVLLAPRGRASQMNAGARDCTADVLLFLHADTQLPVGADQLIADALHAGHQWGRFDVHIDGTYAALPVLPVVARPMNLRSRLTGIATGDQAIFVKRAVFESLGGFADVPLMEDVELSTRLRRHSAPACLRTPVLTSGRRWEQHGVWRTIGLMWWLRAAYFFGADPDALARRYGYAPRPDSAAAAVAIFARAPLPGLAKTRLIPALGAQGAARAQRRFTRQTLRLASAAATGPVTLWCAPDAGHRFFRALHRACGVALQSQCGGDLGARMQHAFAHHFASRPDQPLVLIGTDCPVLAPAHLQAAARALRQHDVVIVPAEDGGYVLIGMRRLVPEVFERIEWSTPRVMAQTRDRLLQAGVHWLEMPTLWDVDEPADWLRLQALGTPW
jgi:rSAM/selenodomain-associated transferase 2/rSAM/selenodomain-associated transferase 1